MQITDPVQIRIWHIKEHSQLSNKKSKTPLQSGLRIGKNIFSEEHIEVVRNVRQDCHGISANQSHGEMAFHTHWWPSTWRKENGRASDWVEKLEPHTHSANDAATVENCPACPRHRTGKLKTRLNRNLYADVPSSTTGAKSGNRSSLCRMINGCTQRNMFENGNCSDKT